MQYLLNSAKSVLVAAMLASSASAVAYDYYNIVPAPGEVAELSEMLLSFNGLWEQLDRTKKFSFTGPEGVELPPLCSGSIGTEGYLFDFDGEVITTPGEYTLYIPEGRFGVNGRLCPEAYFTWTVVGPQSGGDDTGSVYSVYPAQGDVHSLSEIVLNFNGDWAQGDRSKKFAFTGPEGMDLPALMSYSDGSGYIFYFEDDAEITEPGEYSLHIPEGRFTVNGVDAPEATFVWTIVEGGMIPGGGLPQYAIMPEQGTYQSLSEGFSLWFDTEETLTVDPTAVYLDGPEGEYALYVEVSRNMPYVTVIPVDADGEPVELTAAGDYILIFSLGSITVGDVSNDEPLVFTYTVAGNGMHSGWVGDYTAVPADDSTVSALKSVVITFDASSVTVAEFAGKDDFPYLVDNETLETVAGATVYAEENMLYISLTKEITASGYYTLVIPAALISIDGAKLGEDMYLSYEVVGTGSANFEYTFSLDPSDGDNIGAESPVSVTFSGDQLVSVANNPFAAGKDQPHFTNDMGAYNPNLIVEVSGMTYTFTHQWPFEVDGEYTLVIPAGYFTLTSTSGEVAKNGRIEAKYYVKTTSINSLTGDDIRQSTFTLQGIRVDGKAMPAGVYIVNGKKTYIK